MDKMKFNIGDTVVCYGGVGKIVCATNDFYNYSYGVQIEGHRSRNITWIPENNLRLVSKPKYQVVVTSDGKRTEAVKYVDGEFVAKGESSCDERYDKFSFETGMMFALNRMIKNEINANLFNGKAIALNINGKMPKGFTPNKVYQFKDGLPAGIKGRSIPAVTKDDMKNNTGWVKDWFFPVVE